ncbi:MAG: GntR family transcriptional regulator [Kiritimatiellales bacterium]
MELLAVQSKTDQVISFLRNTIKKGEYAPDSRLNGVRDLAQQFKVSTRVISSALETLQKERLVRCEHGRGIFIEPWSEDNMIEVYMLLWGMENKPVIWFNEFIKMTYPPFLRNNYSFNIRTVVRNSEEEKHLDAELSRINNMSTVKCVLANATPYTLDQLRKFQQLHCPVVFIDDPMHEEAKDFHCNKITGDNAKHGIHCVEFMVERGCKEITLFTTNREAYFVELFFDAVKKTAAKNGVKLHVYELSSGIHQKDHEAIINEYNDIFEKAAKDKKLDKPVLLYALKPELFCEVPAAQKRLAVDCPVIFPSFSSDLMTGFYGAIYDMIEKVIKEPKEVRQELIDIPFRITDLTCNESFIINQSKNKETKK